MTYQSQADYWDAKAAAAEAQVRNVKDPLAMDSWLMIADSCRQLAGQFRELEEQKPVKPTGWTILPQRAGLDGK